MKIDALPLTIEFKNTIFLSYHVLVEEIHIYTNVSHRRNKPVGIVLLDLQVNESNLPMS